MEWIIGGYTIGACAMAGMLAYIILSGQERLDGYVGICIIIAMSLLWPVTVAALVVGAALDWRDRHRRLARRRRKPRLYRWSDHDRYWWRFIYARERGDYRPIAIELTSRGGPAHDDHDARPINILRFSAFGHTLIAILPEIIRPWRRWVDTSRYSWASERGGYWDTGPCEYGFSCCYGHLSVSLGRVTNDSSTEQRWSCSLPWRAWRHVRFSIYGLEGEHIWSQFDADRPRLPADRIDRPDSASWWDRQRTAEDAAPRVDFEFLDYDKVRITASTQIHEREWHLGEGKFRWLSWFAPKKVRRSLDIRFSDETGRRKGSWKGGTIGSGIDMLPGELHEAAFARYAAQHEMTYPAPVALERVDGKPLEYFGKDGVGVPVRTGFGKDGVGVPVRTGFGKDGVGVPVRTGFGKDGVGVPVRTGFGTLDAAAKRIEGEA